MSIVSPNINQGLVFVDRSEKRIVWRIYLKGLCHCFSWSANSDCMIFPTCHWKDFKIQKLENDCWLLNNIHCSPFCWVIIERWSFLLTQLSQIVFPIAIYKSWWSHKDCMAFSTANLRDKVALHWFELEEVEIYWLIEWQIQMLNGLCKNLCFQIIFLNLGDYVFTWNVADYNFSAFYWKESCIKFWLPVARNKWSWEQLRPWIWILERDLPSISASISSNELYYIV